MAVTPAASGFRGPTPKTDCLPYIPPDLIDAGRLFFSTIKRISTHQWKRASLVPARYFEFHRLHTSAKREIVAGVTTFFTMVYIIIVNPKVLEAAGIPFGPSLVATALTAFLGTLLMGVYAKRPFAIAPYMGQNAFVAYTLVKVMGFTWQVALGGIFISGLVFALLTLTHVRGWLVHSIPAQLKVAFSAGLGLFLSLIGFNISGIVLMGVPDAPLRLGNVTQPDVLLAILGFLLMGALMIRKVNGAIFIGIMTVTLLALGLGLIQLPPAPVSLPPDIRPILGQLDIAGALQPEFLPMVFLIFILIFVDTMGTLIGVAMKAGFLDERGHLPDIEKPMLCDALSNMAGSFLGTTTSGAYAESLAGIEAGGRTGFTSVVTAMLFLLALFFAPLFAVVPAYAYGPALVVVGMLMMASVTRLNVEDLSEWLPVFVTMALIVFTYNLGIGMTAGFLLYPIIKVLAGRHHEVTPGVWVLAVISLMFFLTYPY